MVFSSPTTDIAFKKLFGDQKKSDITRSFLNAILERKEGALITEITINDNANLPPTDEQKRSFVDISCIDQSGKKYIIEMQVARQKFFLERAQYYTAFGLAQQLNNRDSYGRLLPVIFIGVLGFNLFTRENDYLTHHLITNTKTGKQTMYHSEYHFIELKKFTKELEKLKTETDKWIYLIKEADILKQIPQQMKDSPELMHAFDALEQGAWTKKELEAYFFEVNAERTRRDIEETAQEDRENKLKEMQEKMEKVQAETQEKIEKAQIEIQKKQAEMQKKQLEAQEKIEKAQVEAQKRMEEAQVEAQKRMEEAQVEAQKRMEKIARELLKKMNEKEVAAVTGLSLAEVKKIAIKK